MTKITLDFSPCIGLPREPPPRLHIEFDNIPSHQFSSMEEFRGPQNLLCYQPGELKTKPPANIEYKTCDTCFRKFDSEDTLQRHISIDHEDRNKKGKK